MRPGAEMQILLVHRPRYDDWSLPKGKLSPGETEADAAMREVLEETGYDVRLLGELGRVRYVDSRGRDKQVVYYAMEPTGESTFEPGDEVDVVRWVAASDAARVLSYERDARIVARAIRG
jgi:8-oxo-dGTP pyrophosphatase MutT (NUDIX family)